MLCAPRGVMRMVLMGALSDANLWTRSTGASQETKNHWARRGKLIRELLAAMPAPVNPRDPYEDLPGEPTPEEAAAAWAERARSEDARRDARVAAAPLPGFVPSPAPRHFYHPESDSLMMTEDGSHPGTDGLVEEVDVVRYEEILRRQHAATAIGDDLAGLLG